MQFTDLLPTTEKTDHLGFTIIVASLLTALTILFSVLHFSRQMEREQLGIDGTRLIHLFAQIAPAGGDLTTVFEKYQLAVPDLAAETAFAYLTVRNLDGQTVRQQVRPGLSVPSFVFIADPSRWYGERVVEQEDAGGKVLEFYGPVLDDGMVIGTVSLAFLAPGYDMSRFGMSGLARLALPAILLGTLIYIILAIELKPLRRISMVLKELSENESIEKPITIQGTRTTHELAKNLGDFLETMRRRIQHLEDLAARKFSTNKVLRYKIARLTSVLDAIPAGIFVMDESLTVIFANQKLASFVNVDAQSVIGQTLTGWCDDEELLAFLSRYKGLHGRLFRADELTYQPAAFPGRTMSVTTAPLHAAENAQAGNGYGTLVILWDVTAEALARAARGEFVAHVSHELKSPLNVILMYSDLLREEEGKSPEFRVEAVNVIHDEVERLTLLINNMLSISKIEMGSISLDRQRVKTLSLLRDIFDSVSRSVKSDGITFSLQLPGELSPIMVDKYLLTIAVTNLLTNAIKYNRPGGRVVLSAEETESQIFVRVKDTGIGIAPEEQAKIFEKFYRSEDDEVRKKSGHGLGLPLAKNIVELHGGTIALYSEPGEGSEFSIVFPKNQGMVRERI